MYDGSISGNTATTSGGGVWVTSHNSNLVDGYFYMMGGVIKNNTAAMLGGTAGGGGVGCNKHMTTQRGGHFSKSGNSIIYGKNEGSNSNMTSADDKGHAVLFLEWTPISSNNVYHVRNTTLGSGVDFNRETGPWN